MSQQTLCRFAPLTSLPLQGPLEVLISNEAQHPSNAFKRIAGVSSLGLLPGNDFGPDLRVDRGQIGSAELCG